MCVHAFVSLGLSPFPVYLLPRVPDWAPLLVAPGGDPGPPGPCRSSLPPGEEGHGGVGGDRVWELSRRPPGHPQLAPRPSKHLGGPCLRGRMSCLSLGAGSVCGDGPGQPDHPLPAWSSPGARVSLKCLPLSRGPRPLHPERLSQTPATVQCHLPADPRKGSVREPGLTSALPRPSPVT